MTTNNQINTPQDFKHIIILGGGTAGWMTASLLANRWHEKGIKISVVESPDIGIIGVGEGSTPSLKIFFDSIGVPESEWMSQCNATYKNGIRFVNWSTTPGFESYFHPFTSTVDPQTQSIFEYNTVLRRKGINVHAHPDRFFLNTKLAEKSLSPKANYNFPLPVSYGYHFDATLIGKFLRERAIKIGVNHIEAEVCDVVTNQSGQICSLKTTTDQTLSGDFFVDCSGFKSLLIEKTLNVRHISFKENLFNDAAVTFPTPITKSIPSETVSTAMKCGWAWKIPLTNRFGNGYVYSSDFCTSDDAETELRQSLNAMELDSEARHLKMRVGRFEKHWVKNCLAVGLSQGFIEPLEATALHFIQATVGEFMTAVEKGNFSSKHRDTFNHRINRNFEGVRDYIVTHYKTNSRKDTPYWEACRNNKNISNSLMQLFTTWVNGENLTKDLRQQDIDKYYVPISWHVIFAGMGVFPDQSKLKAPGSDLKNFDLSEVDEFIKRCSVNFVPHAQHL